MRTTRRTFAAAAAMAVAAGAVVTAAPGGAGAGAPARPPSERRFERISSFSVYTNNDDPADETVAEIATVTSDGRTLLYTDSELEQIGFVDITDPEAPTAAGTLAMGAEPTSVAVVRGYALVTVDADAPHLAVIDVATREVLRQIPLAGQPDAVDVSPDGRFAAVVIENERNEDITVDGVEGGLPQLPAGLLQIVDLVGDPGAWTVRDVALTGLASYGTDDPEPEYVDIDGANRAVVTLQENNHLVVVDLRRGTVLSDFSAGSVDLTEIDATEDGAIRLTESLDDVVREPDGVAWLDGNRFVTANEGDLFGGSRGFSIFTTHGRLVYDSGSSFEHLAVQHGHYPDERSENKGTEPEGVAVARYGATTYLFVGSERGNFVAVYRIRGAREPEFVQLLPTAIGPEGLLPIPSRGLFVATSEVDDPEFGVRTAISIFRLGDGPAPYPDIVSVDDADGTPIPWGALSGLTPDPDDPAVLRAVWDSFYAGDPRIFTLDVSTDPAVVTGSIAITGATGEIDGEGIAAAPDGTTWIASEGNASDTRPNRLLQVDETGAVLTEVGLPAEILACRDASPAGALGSGFEGVTVVPGPGDGYRLYVAQQRGWAYATEECADLDDEPGWTRIWIYDPAAGAWDHIPYELEPTPPNAGWVGLSEIVLLDGGTFGLIERDNLSGDWSTFKALVEVDLSDGVATRSEKTFADLLPALAASEGWFTDKPEGFTVAADGSVYVVTDNDGVDGSTGETQLLRLGPVAALFG